MAIISQRNNLPNCSWAGYKSLYSNNGEITEFSGRVLVIAQVLFVLRYSITLLLYYRGRFVFSSNRECKNDNYTQYLYSIHVAFFYLGHRDSLLIVS